MNIFKNKMLLLVPVIALVVLFIFAITQIPSVKQSPKNLPIAIVNEDEGVEIPQKGTLNLGATIEKNIKKSSSVNSNDDEPAIKWVTVSSFKEVKEGMNDKRYYGAIVIPKDYSAKQASLQSPKPVSPEIQLFVNQGMNAIASNTVSQMFNSIYDKLSENTSLELLKGYKKQGNMITTEQASFIASPIKKVVTNVNSSGTQGNAPVSLFQPLWMASIVAAVILWNSTKKLQQKTRKKRLVIKLIQVLVGAICAILIGFTLTWIADVMLGFEIPKFMDTALFLAITNFSFILMISAILSWLGFAGVPIFVLMLFFGAPLLAMAPEFMPSFYHDWIFPWLPMRFMVDGLRELFFFSKTLSWNQPTSVLCWIGLGSLVVFFMSILKEETKNENTTLEHSGN
nr:ABC transporter permease [Viridibacillus sp. JNUCC-6]